MTQRSAYKDVMSELYQRGLKPSLRFPAKLSILQEKDGKEYRHPLSSVAKAEKFIEDLDHPPEDA